MRHHITTTSKRTNANNRAGRATLATIHTPVHEESEVNFVMMSHEAPEADGKCDSDPNPSDAMSCPSLVSDSDSDDDIESDDD